MFDSAHPLASGWLWACVVVFTVVFGIPLTVAPLRWARRFGWRVPDQDPEVTIYLGRCLGTVILVLAYLIAGAAMAGLTPAGRGRGSRHLGSSGFLSSQRADSASTSARFSPAPSMT